jgi:hypothetical protein
VKTIKVQRGPRAALPALAALATPAERLARSVAGQLFHELREWTDGALRRA